MNIGILLSGCGVYDGSEIQEAVLAMLSIQEIGGNCIPISVNKNQYHVVNHVSGESTLESRNMLIESARISRGVIREINTILPNELDALVMPGGFGNAKNLTNLGYSENESEILPEVKLLLVNLINIGTPIVALCVSPIVLALALKNSAIHVELSLGHPAEKSSYDIRGFHAAIEKNGAKSVEKSSREILIDTKNRVICAPCYMHDSTILEVRENIAMAMNELKKMLA